MLLTELKNFSNDSVKKNEQTNGEKNKGNSEKTE